MGQRPKLDPASFEQLLLAAWILQRRLEEEARRKTVATRLAAQSETPVIQSAPSPKKDLAVQVNQVQVNQVQVNQVQVSQVQEAPRVVPNPAVPSAVDGSRKPIAVAAKRTRKTSQTVLSFQSGLKRITKDAKQVEKKFVITMKLVGDRLKPAISKAAALIQDRVSSFASQKIKVRIPLSPRQALATISVPVLVLVPLLFMLMQVSRQGRLSVAAATESIPAPLTSSPPRAPQGPVSHHAITDSSVAASLSGLSRYEVRSLRRQALFGDDSAALALGMLYETGRYVPQSCIEAAMWVQRSAEWGNPAAQYNLALRYRDGDGLTADQNEAQKWLHKAAEQRYARATEFNSAQAE